VVPRQLPAAVRHFAGRGADLERLSNLVDDTGSADRVVIVAIAGTAGIGKTTLAVHWAHRMAARFPDGQLYINLRGFDPAGPAVTPSEAIRGFLDAFGVPPAQPPLSLDAQGALYRSLLAGRQMLVLLDNARDADQVYPLLPGSAGCLVIVTSRNRLTGLVVAAGAHPLTLDLFTPAESCQLLTHLIGPDRVAAEPHAVDDIVAWCARLPLALSIVAARAAARPGFSLATLTSRPPPVRAVPGGLDAFDGGDAATDVRSVFSWSYRQLAAEAAALFRLLGLQPGPDIAVSAVASLAGHPVGRVRRPLSELAAAHLVDEPAPDRYACHDLLRAYATELAESLDPPAHRRQAIHRILDHYLHTAHAAALLLNPDRDPLALSHAEPGVTVAQLTDDRQALGWLMAEHRALLAAIDLAVAGGFDRHVWQLAWALANFLDRQGHWYAWVETQTAALEAARRLADRAGQAHAHRALGGGYARLGRNDEARTHLGHALDLYGQLDDIPGQARAYLNLGWLSGQEGQHEQALHHARLAFDLFRAARQVAGQASTLNAIGWCHALLGDHAAALVHCDQARTLHRELGDRLGEAASLDSLGYAHKHLAHYAQAVGCYQQALELYRDLDNQGYAADVLSHLGDAHQAAGDPAASRVAWQSALDILDQLGHPQADKVRAKLRGIDPAGC
jgi:tetratricopeptide (TPR) repeat protein